MYNDDNGENRMEEQLSLLQYLEYDAMAILVQMMDMSDDRNHRFPVMRGGLILVLKI